MFSSRKAGVNGWQSLAVTLAPRRCATRLDKPRPQPISRLRSPVTGLVAYRRRLGDWVHKGDLVATVIDPLGEETELHAETDGRLFARHSQPYAWPGRVIGKIAGETPLESRTGNLLSD